MFEACGRECRAEMNARAQAAPLMLALLASFFAWAAHGEPLSQSVLPVGYESAKEIRLRAPATNVKAWSDSSGRTAPILPVLYNHAPMGLPPGVARTSVEHRSQDRNIVSSAGLLCGLEPSPNTSGAASATGYDPQGKFIGAKLAFAF